jgi:hypothetical protein
MFDPLTILSIASSVAGILSLAGSVSKTTIQFISSITDAPENARSLARVINSLSIALTQVQRNILNPSLEEALDLECDFKQLEECLASCTMVFSALDAKIRASGIDHEPSGDISIKRAAQKCWGSIKWSFTDDYLEEVLRKIEAEKANLILLNSTFTAYVSCQSFVLSSN